jgi:hypothetical protein
VELALVESIEQEVISTEITQKLGSWATGSWLKDKFYDPDSGFSEWHVDYTAPGFSKDQLVPLGQSVEAAA